jgi:hypothetical protein
VCDKKLHFLKGDSENFWSAEMWTKKLTSTHEPKIGGKCGDIQSPFSGLKGLATLRNQGTG